MSAADELATVGDWIRYAATRFASDPLYFGHGTDNAWDEALALVRGALRLPHEQLEFVLGARLLRAERASLEQLVERRVVDRVPVPYLTGEAYFAHRRYLIEAGVLIPRSPIAELIENDFAPWLEQIPARVLDLCAGSGCIGIACAHQFPDATVVLSDVDPRCVALAHRNVALHGLESRVQVVSSDLFASLPETNFDLIVTNPPYVAAEDFDAMPPEYRHEPRSAITAGADGLDVVRRILREAHRHLSERGMLVCEVGSSVPHLLAAYPRVPFVWPEFERGGDGVFVIDAANLPV